MKKTVLSSLICTWILSACGGSGHDGRSGSASLSPTPPITSPTPPVLTTPPTTTPPVVTTPPTSTPPVVSTPPTTTPPSPPVVTPPSAPIIFPTSTASAMTIVKPFEVRPPDASFSPELDEIFKETNNLRQSAGQNVIQRSTRLDGQAQQFAELLTHNYDEENFVITPFSTPYLFVAKIPDSQNIADVLARWKTTPKHQQAMQEHWIQKMGLGIVHHNNHYFVVQALEYDDPIAYQFNSAATVANPLDMVYTQGRLHISDMSEHGIFKYPFDENKAGAAFQAFNVKGKAGNGQDYDYQLLVDGYQYSRFGLISNEIAPRTPRIWEAFAHGVKSNRDGSPLTGKAQYEGKGIAHFPLKGPLGETYELKVNFDVDFGAKTVTGKAEGGGEKIEGLKADIRGRYFDTDVSSGTNNSIEGYFYGPQGEEMAGKIKDLVTQVEAAFGAKKKP